MRAVPYWVDDESVRPSMIASAPEPLATAASTSHEPAPGIASAPVRQASKKNRPRPSIASADGDDLTHPLLGDGPSLKLMPDPHEVKGFGSKGPRGRAAKQVCRVYVCRLRLKF